MYIKQICFVCFFLIPWPSIVYFYSRIGSSNLENVGLDIICKYVRREKHKELIG